MNWIVKNQAGIAIAMFAYEDDARQWFHDSKLWMRACTLHILCYGKEEQIL